MDKNKILKEKYDWLEKDDFWKAFNTWVIKHDAVMRIAEEEGIVFNTPQILTSNENSNVAIYGKASLDGKDVWTTGEAAPENCKNPYFFAMAEKRWKDRATLMLVGLYHLGFYSEIEADDFEQPNKEDLQAETDNWKQYRDNPLGFTKHKQSKWSEVDEGLLVWIINNVDKQKYIKRAENELEYRAGLEK
tara:strand:- start:31 stop:600 length:570 start_codon:yes stop_codon:yes gene_type:complete